MGFPVERPRRLRRSEGLRRLVRETRLSVSDFVYPMFVVPGSGVAEEIGSMPGQFRYSVDRLIEAAKRVEDAGVPAVLLFGIPEKKDPAGSEAYAPAGAVQRATAALKEKTKLLVITDVCLCEYTSHGHCGVVEGGRVLNDPTLEILARAAVSHARAGADVVAPSDMMDGRVGAIRSGLDEAGFEETAILSYAAKYASAFYGPFREAAESTPQFGDRQGYQMDPANAQEALREMALDVAEGADMLMVKPALAYLDVIRRAKETFHLPVAAYNVSGECSMIAAAARMGWIDGRRATLEVLTAIKRAGADIIITYAAVEAAGWLAER
jgi:porphobilinogen synthase